MQLLISHGHYKLMLL